MYTLSQMALHFYQVLFFSVFHCKRVNKSLGLIKKNEGLTCRQCFELLRKYPQFKLFFFCFEPPIRLEIPGFVPTFLQKFWLLRKISHLEFPTTPLEVTVKIFCKVLLIYYKIQARRKHSHPKSSYIHNILELYLHQPTRDRLSQKRGVPSLFLKKVR